MKFNERIQRALKMSAVGDAIGNKFEFQHHINPFEVHDHIRSSSPIVITDDTQMTLFGFEAIQQYDQDTTIGHIQDGYLRWYATQKSSEPCGTGLLNEPLMHHQRAPGMTCLSALKSLSMGNQVENNSYGCGSVMRLLPFVYLLEHQPDDAMSLAIQSGYITHKHEVNEKAIVDYMLVAKLALDMSALTVQETLQVGSFVSNIVKAPRITTFGAGWTAHECVCMAAWAALTASSLEDCLIKSITHDGDSDSVGAVACGLYGLLHSNRHKDDMLMNILFNRIVEKDVVQTICDGIV